MALCGACTSLNGESPGPAAAPDDRGAAKPASSPRLDSQEFRIFLLEDCIIDLRPYPDMNKPLVGTFWEPRELGGRKQAFFRLRVPVPSITWQLAGDAYPIVLSKPILGSRNYDLTFTFPDITKKHCDLVLRESSSGAVLHRIDSYAMGGAYDASGHFPRPAVADNGDKSEKLTFSYFGWTTYFTFTEPPGP
jgi:hypothetical protein